MAFEELKPGYEYVHTVTDYHDGPRKGIDNYKGKPHAYECVFDESGDNYSELFWLAPLDAETFQSAMEDWAIWQRWELHSIRARQTSARIRRCRPNQRDIWN